MTHFFFALLILVVTNAVHLIDTGKVFLAEVYEQTVFKVACDEGFLDILKGLLHSGKQFDQETTFNGFISAARFGYADLVEYLIEGCGVDPVGGYNMALDLAAFQGHVAVIQVLCKYDPVLRCKSAVIVLEKALKNGSYPVANLLWKSIQKFQELDPDRLHDILEHACARGFTKTAGLILSHPLVIPSFANNSALSAACTNGHFEIVKLLLRDPGVLRKDCTKMAAMACTHGNFDIFKLMFYSKASLSFSKTYPHQFMMNFLLVQNIRNSHTRGLGIFKERFAVVQESDTSILDWALMFYCLRGTKENVSEILANIWLRKQNLMTVLPYNGCGMNSFLVAGFLYARLYDNNERKFNPVDKIPFLTGDTLSGLLPGFLFFDSYQRRIAEATVLTSNFANQYTSWKPLLLYTSEIYVRLFDSKSKELLDPVTYPFAVGQSLDSLFGKSIFFNHLHKKIPGTFILSEESVLNFIPIRPLTVYGLEFFVRFFDNESKKLRDAVAFPFAVGQSLDSLFGQAILFEHRKRTSDRTIMAGDFLLSEESVTTFNCIEPLLVYGCNDYGSVKLIKKQEGLEDVVIEVPVAFKELKQDDFNLTDPFVQRMAKRSFESSSNSRWHIFIETALPINIKDFPLSSITIRYQESALLVIERVLGENRGELTAYINTASLVDDKKYFTEMRRLILTIQSLASDPLNVYSNNTPFISVLAPSGTGKTQLAISMNQNDCPNIHLLSFNTEQYNLQTIYSAVLSVSFSFHDQITRDLAILAELKDGLFDRSTGLDAAENEFMKGDLVDLVSTCRFIIPFRNTKLYTVGFLNHVLAKRQDHLENPDGREWEAYLFGNPLREDMPAMSPAEFAETWGPMRKGMPSVILDEFGLTNQNRTRLLYAQNLIRALSIVCITMGTDSKASNLIDSSTLGTEQSSNSTTNQPWVYVVHRLPRTKVSAVPGFNEFKTVSTTFLDSVPATSKDDWTAFFGWIENGLSTSFPRFLRFGFEGLCVYLGEGTSEEKSVPEALQAMLNSICRMLYLSKYSVKLTDWPIFGQVAHLLYQSFNTLPVDLVHQYQSHLLPPSKWNDHSFVQDNSLLEFEITGTPEPYNPDDPMYSHFYRTNWCFPLQRISRNGSLTLMTRDGSSWRSCRAYHKAPETDNLSTLALLTNAGGSSGFFIDGESSLYKAYFKIYLFNRKIGPSNQNPLASATEKGHILESFAQLAVILASTKAKDKFNGTPFPEACLEIARNLSKTTQICTLQSDPDCPLKEFFDIHATGLPRLPLLGPMNSSYEFLKAFMPNSCLGSLRYCKDSDQIDSTIIPAMLASSGVLWLIVMEMKNYFEQKLTNSGLGTISEKAEKYDDPDSKAQASESRPNRIVIIFSMEARYNPEPIVIKGKQVESGAANILAQKRDTSSAQEIQSSIESDSKRLKQSSSVDQTLITSECSTDDLILPGDKGKVTGAKQDVKTPIQSSNEKTRWNLRPDQILFLSKTVDANLSFEKYRAPGLTADPELSGIKTIFIVFSLKDIFGPDYFIDETDGKEGYKLYEEDGDEAEEAMVQVPVKASSSGLK